MEGDKTQVWERLTCLSCGQAFEVEGCRTPDGITCFGASPVLARLVRHMKAHDDMLLIEVLDGGKAKAAHQALGELLAHLDKEGK